MTDNATRLAQQMKDVLQEVDSCLTCRFFKPSENVLYLNRGELIRGGRCQRYPPRVVRLQEDDESEAIWYTEAKWEFPVIRVEIANHGIVERESGFPAWCGEFQRAPVVYQIWRMHDEHNIITESAEFTA